MRYTILVTIALSLLACEDSFETGPDAGPVGNADGGDAGGGNAGDSAWLDSGQGGANSGDRDGGLDAAPNDGGSAGDSGATDGGTSDSGTSDSGTSDSGTTDTGTADGGTTDMGTGDTGGSADMGTTPSGDCVSGATGTHGVRFTWRGNGPNSTAYVGYEQNELPDTSRWKAGAYARSFNYTPQFGDTFLGIGGLIMDGTKFMDVELSTVGLSTIRNVTIAILGRSYNTTAGGSFSWMTFDGVGAAPSGTVANSAPYQWYRADATAAFVPGNGGVLLRIEPGGPSNSLVVNSVELCFDAN